MAAPPTAVSWIPKLKGNVDRDRRNKRELAEAGWHVIRLWEHQPIEEMADEVAAAVETLRHSRTGGNSRREAPAHAPPGLADGGV